MKNTRGLHKLSCSRRFAFMGLLPAQAAEKAPGSNYAARK